MNIITSVFRNTNVSCSSRGVLVSRNHGIKNSPQPHTENINREGGTRRPHEHSSHYLWYELVRTKNTSVNTSSHPPLATMTELSHSPSQEQPPSSPKTAAMTGAETSPLDTERPNVISLYGGRPGDCIIGALNDEIDDKDQPTEGNKRRRERRRRPPVSVECHPFFNGAYLAYLEGEVSKKETDAKIGSKTNRENMAGLTPPTLTSAKSHEDAHAWNKRRYVRRNSSSRATPSA